MSNRRKSKVLIKCQKDDCQKPAVAIRKAPHDLGGSIKEGTPIFSCADHVKELERDLAQAVIYHQQALAQREAAENDKN